MQERPRLWSHPRNFHQRRHEHDGRNKPGRYKKLFRSISFMLAVIVGSIGSSWYSMMKVEQFVIGSNDGPSFSTTLITSNTTSLTDRGTSISAVINSSSTTTTTTTTNITHAKQPAASDFIHRAYAARTWNLYPPFHKKKNFSSIIDPDDPILTKGHGWDTSPIVLEEFQLLFFTIPKVGTTVWKQLFRRMMKYPLWPLEDGNIPHNPQFNGLVYLYDVPYDKAVEILTSPNWTRAIFVRDPLERVLSAYLDKGQRGNGTYVKRHCCGIKPFKQSGKMDTSPLEQLQQEQQQQIELQEQQRMPYRQQQQQNEQFDQVSYLRGRDNPHDQRLLSKENPSPPDDDDHRRLQQEQQPQPQHQLVSPINKNSRTMNMLHSQVSLQATQIANRQSIAASWPPAVPLGNPLPKMCSTLESSSSVSSSESYMISWEMFVYDFLSKCTLDPHWKSQTLWGLPFVNFVGHFETIIDDARQLLEQIGAWDEYGAKGWPGGGSIFHENTARHKTSSKELWTQYYASPTLRQHVFELYQQDYHHPLLNLTGPQGVRN